MPENKNLRGVPDVLSTMWIYQPVECITLCPVWSGFDVQWKTALTQKTCTRPGAGKAIKTCRLSRQKAGEYSISRPGKTKVRFQPNRRNEKKRGRSFSHRGEKNHLQGISSPGHKTVSTPIPEIIPQRFPTSQLQTHVPHGQIRQGVLSQGNQAF